MADNRELDMIRAAVAVRRSERAKNAPTRPIDPKEAVRRANMIQTPFRQAIAILERIGCLCRLVEGKGVGAEAMVYPIHVLLAGWERSNEHQFQIASSGTIVDGRRISTVDTVVVSGMYEARVLTFDLVLNRWVGPYIDKEERFCDPVASIVTAVADPAWFDRLKAGGSGTRVRAPSSKIARPASRPTQ